MKNKSMSSDKLKISYAKEIESFLLNTNSKNSRVTYSNYLNALIALSKKGTTIDFLRIYSKYLRIKGTHLLKINDAIVISNFLDNCNDFLMNIKYLSRLTKGRKTDYDSAVVINSFILSTYERPEIMKIRIELLSILINENIYELCKENSLGLTKCIFRMHISLSYVGVEINVLKSEFGLLFYWAKTIAKNNLYMGLNFQRLLERFELSGYRNIPWTEQSETFLNLLEDLVCKNYSLVCCNVKMANQLIHFYKSNPEIFHSIKPELSEFEKADFILEPFFKNYHLPEVFFKNYTAFADLRYPGVELRLFEHVMKGYSVRKFGKLPIKMDKKACHILRDFKTQKPYAFWKYFVVCKFLSLDVDLKFAEEVFDRIIDLGNWDYWVDTFEVLYKKGLPNREIIAVVDYLNNAVFARGLEVNVRKKSLNNLLSDINKWHRELSMLRIKSISLPKSVINPFETCSDNKTYIIKQLTTSRQLYLEGYDLKHCVYTYVSRCLWRDCQIFSLRMLDREEETPLLTIELDGASIVQIRGKHNRSATLSELELVKSWAKKEKLYLHEAA